MLKRASGMHMHMNISKLLLLTHLLPMLAVGLAGPFLHSPAGSSLVAYAGMLVLCGGSGAVVAVWQLRKGIGRLKRDDPTRSASTGLVELDRVLDHWRQARHQDREQLREVESLCQLLALIDLDAAAPVSDRDPAAMLSRALGETGRSAAVEVSRVIELAETASRQACESSGAARRQSEVLERTIGFVEGVSAKADDVAGNVSGAVDAAGEICMLASDGEELVQQLNEGIRRIESNVLSGEKRILALSERLKEISSIVETIEAISGRTDMLALNAAIESVRAGEEGRGFAVVAEEVRKLAEHTANASRAIAELVNTMQAETQETISSMGAEHSLVRSEAGQIDNATSVLEQITRTAGALEERTTLIMRTTAEQLQETQAIVQGLQEMSQLADEGSATTQTLRKGTEELAAATRDLEDRISPLYHCDRERRVDGPTTGAKPSAPEYAARDEMTDSHRHRHQGTPAVADRIGALAE